MHKRNLLNNEESIERLQVLVKERFGKPLHSVKSFETLASNVRLGVQTLRRFFGKIDAGKKISVSSLSILCHYVGFSDWQEFSLSFEHQQNISDKDKSYIENMSSFFENGKRYNIDYYQNTMIVDTLNDFAKVIYKKKENLMFFAGLYQKNNWCSDYFFAWLPNYNYFGQNWFREILKLRIRNTENILAELALTNFLFLGEYLSEQKNESVLDIESLKKIYQKYRKNDQYMPYHEMRYHTILLICAKKNNDEEEFQRIVKYYLNGLENSGLVEIHQQELLIFFCNTLLWLQEYDLAYQYLKKIKSFLKCFASIKREQNSMHFYGINMVFVKTTFLLAWAANKDPKTDGFELEDCDFKNITGLLYNDYIKIMYLAKCIISENGLAKKKIIFQDLKVLVNETNYSKIYNLLRDLDSDFSKYFV